CARPRARPGYHPRFHEPICAVRRTRLADGPVDWSPARRVPIPPAVAPSRRFPRECGEHLVLLSRRGHGGLHARTVVGPSRAHRDSGHLIIRTDLPPGWGSILIDAGAPRPLGGASGRDHVLVVQESRLDGRPGVRGVRLRRHLAFDRLPGLRDPLAGRPAALVPSGHAERRHRPSASVTSRWQRAIRERSRDGPFDWIVVAGVSKDIAAVHDDREPLADAVAEAEPHASRRIESDDLYPDAVPEIPE